MLSYNRFFILIVSFATSCCFGIGNDFKLKIEVLDGDRWLLTNSYSVAAGSRLVVRCTVNSNASEPLSWNRKSPDLGFFHLINTGSNYEVGQNHDHIQLNESGTYSCNSSAFSRVFELYVYSLKLLQNASIPTRVEYDHIGSLQLVRRNIDHDSYSASAGRTLSCTMVTGGPHLVEMVTVRWDGGLFGLVINQTELLSLYTHQTIRNHTVGEIVTQLSLNSPVLDSRAYGEYRCIFGFPSSGDVVGRVYLHVPPILRLVYDPPPLPPANFSSSFTCADPPCRALTDESNISDSAVVNWTSACEVIVAYPPVLRDSLTWAWTYPNWASYAVQRVQSFGKSAYFSELRNMEQLEQESGFPFKVLDRRRRDVESPDSHYLETKKRPPGPVIFLCWAKNILGESAVWWPGPSEDAYSGFWMSVWWPVLGVTLELISLIIVLLVFRYCNRGGLLRSSASTRQVQDTSFGLSRLFDREQSSQGNPTSRSQAAAKRPPQLRSPGNVPYIPLSSSLRSEAEVRQSESYRVPVDEKSMQCHTNPLLRTGLAETEPNVAAPNGRDTDEYFWDSEAESSLPVNSH